MKPIQPLSYQIHPSSCWVTSVLNGLLYLYGNKRPIPNLEFAYRMLHAVLTDDGVGEDTGWEFVLAAIGEGMGLTIVTSKGEEVEGAIEKLDFSNQVAVCDVDGGEHSVLLLGKNDQGFFVFDPDWENVKDVKDSVYNDGKYSTDPANPAPPNKKLQLSNLWISQEHLFSVQRGVPGNFRLTAEKYRTLSVMTKSK